MTFCDSCFAQILNSLLNSMKSIKEKNAETTDLQEEKANILKKSTEEIELGLGEAQVIHIL